MIGQVLDLFSTSINAVIPWFSQIMSRTGAAPLYVSVMTVVLSISLFIKPLLGPARSGSSDVVKGPRRSYSVRRSSGSKEDES